MTRLATKRILSKSNKNLADSAYPVRCPFCNEEHKNGHMLKRHVKKIHWQIY